VAIPLFAHVAAASYFIPAGAGFRYWRTSPVPVRVFTVFCIYSTLHLIAEFTLGRLGISNLFLLNYHQIVEFSCILFVYISWVKEERTKDLFQYLGLAYGLVWLINKYFYEDPERFSEVISAVAMVFLMFASVIVLNTLVRSAKEPVREHAVFWIALGVLLYGAGTVVVTSFSNTILAMGMEYFNMLWHINWGFTVITNVLYARSFSCRLF
jgi:hypothetical protein